MPANESSAAATENVTSDIAAKTAEVSLLFLMLVILQTEKRLVSNTYKRRSSLFPQASDMIYYYIKSI